MSDELLYDSLKIAETIKVLAKNKNIALRIMLNDIGMGFNSISHMRHGRMPSAENLAKIADYLDCSVDYLLGRTNDVEVANAIELAPEEYPVVIKYRAIGERGQAIVDQLLDELHAKKDAPTAYSDERIEAILQNRPELTELADQIRKLDRDQTLRAIDYIRFLLSQQDPN